MHPSTYRKLNKELHFYLHRTGEMEYKKDYVSYFTNGRSVSSTMMHECEMKGLITHLRGMLRETGHEQSKMEKVKKLIHLLCKWNPYFTVNDKPDMTRINSFIEEKWKYKTVWNIPYDMLSKLIGVLMRKF